MLLLLLRVGSRECCNCCMACRCPHRWTPSR